MAKESTKVHHLEVHPAANGGIHVKHFEHEKDSLGSYGRENPSKAHAFGPEEHGEAMEHIHGLVCGGKMCDMGASGSLNEEGEKHPLDKKNLMKHGESTKHPGFVAVEKKIEKKEGVGKKAAGAILAHSTRHASAAAHKANPHLNRVKGSSY